MKKTVFSILIVVIFFSLIREIGFYFSKPKIIVVVKKNTPTNYFGKWRISQHNEVTIYSVDTSKVFSFLFYRPVDSGKFEMAISTKDTETVYINNKCKPDGNN